MEVEYKYIPKSPEVIDEIFRDEYIRSVAAGEEEVIPMRAEFFDTEDLDLMKEKIALRVRSEGGATVATVKWGGGADEDGLHKRHEINVEITGNLKELLIGPGAAASSRQQPVEPDPAAARQQSVEQHPASSRQQPVVPDLAAATRQNSVGQHPAEAGAPRTAAAGLIELFSRSDIYPKLKALTEGKQLRPLFSMEYTRRQIKLDTGRSVSVLSADRGTIMAHGKEEDILELEIEIYSGDEADLAALGEKISGEYGLLPGRKSKFLRAKELFNR